jgi:hypothetical protein
MSAEHAHRPNDSSARTKEQNMGSERRAIIFGWRQDPNRTRAPVPHLVGEMQEQRCSGLQAVRLDFGRRNRAKSDLNKKLLQHRVFAP